jgi:hypothetical protein
MKENRGPRPSLWIDPPQLPIKVLLIGLTWLRLPAAAGIPLALRVGGAVAIAALSTLALAGLVLLTVLAGPLVLALALVLASLLRSVVGILVLLITHCALLLALAMKARDNDRQQTLSQQTFGNEK